MESGTIGEFSNDLNWRGRCRWTENSKVYTRRIHKKARKNSSDNDTVTTATSTAEGPATATAAENPTTTPPPTEVSSPTVASTASAEVSTASTSKDPKDSAAASTPPTTSGSHTATTSPHQNAGDVDVPESPETLVAKDADSCQQRLREQSLHQEQSSSHKSVDKNVDSPQQPQSQKQLQHQQHVPSLAEDSGSTQPQAQEGSGSQNVELQNVEDSPLTNSNEAQNLKKPSSLHGLNEIPQTSDDGPHSLRVSSPLSSENGLPNGREVAALQFPIGNDSRNDGQLMPVPSEVPSGDGPANVNGIVKPLVISKVVDRVRFKLAKATHNDEIKELRMKLESELDQVRGLVKQFEAKKLHLASYNTQIRNSSLSNGNNYDGSEGGNIGGHSYPQPQHARTDLVDRRVFMRVSSEMGVVGHQEIKPTVLARVNSDLGAARIEPRSYCRQLSVAVMENNHSAGEYAEKEKRTPKANQYYRNSEFFLGKDILPSESIKRLKTNNGRKHSGETEHAFRFGFGFDKSCSSLLQKLRKHNHGWVFNEPVNAKSLGLVDYHDIIKHPMDLGTIKTRLSQNWYKSPREFAEDVRLVFRNAMTYNPKGQDVHIMAEQLSEIFEERWTTIEAEYNSYWKYQIYQDAGLPTPTSRMAPPQSHFRRPHVGRTPVPKKPKARDLNKRAMTYEEKQRLSANLQSMPYEKLDAIVQIINRRNTALSQHDDEIEVDIDNVDTETLWELDRYASNYKKILSKNKRKAELALQARSAADQKVTLMNTTTAIADVRIDSGTVFEKKTAPPVVKSEKQDFNGRSSSSSSDSGSSSSDSDSDSSSADGSDGHSPGR